MSQSQGAIIGVKHIHFRTTVKIFIKTKNLPVIFIHIYVFICICENVYEFYSHYRSLTVTDSRGAFKPQLGDKV